MNGTVSGDVAFKSTKNGRFVRFTEDPWEVVRRKNSDFS